MECNTRRTTARTDLSAHIVGDCVVRSLPFAAEVFMVDLENSTVVEALAEAWTRGTAGKVWFRGQKPKAGGAVS